MEEGSASRTAVLVTQCRAAADGRLAPGRFSDPVSRELLRPDEVVVVDAVRSGSRPRRLGDRLLYEVMRASSVLLTARTILIDEAIEEAANPQVVVLGAGLDARAWRLAALAGVAVWEVDHPASQADKRDRIGRRRLVARSVRFVPVDFAVDSLDGALAGAGHLAERPTTWVWEGVVMYLTRAQVAATMAAVGERSAPGSRLVVNYEERALSSRVGLAVFSGLSRLARRRSPTAGEPRRSSWSPSAMAGLLTGHGFEVGADEDLLSAATRLGLEPEARRHLAASRVAVADRSG
ncbi:MAG: class I SAM-dependent methyltransferase [Acidimicrobiales bacterium]